MTLTKYRSCARPGMYTNYFDDAMTRDHFMNPWKARSGWFPGANIKETESAFNIDIAAPGMNKTDFKVELSNRVLTISAEHKESEKSENEVFSRREFAYGKFSRAFTLPENTPADSITAEYINGILKVVVPKNTEGVKSNTHEIAVV